MSNKTRRILFCTGSVTLYSVRVPGSFLRI